MPWNDYTQNNLKRSKKVSQVFLRMDSRHCMIILHIKLNCNC